MKTIQQRLQSRISRRRNVIRFVENDLATAKTIRKQSTEMFGQFMDFAGINDRINNGRDMVKELTADQKLDKRLKQIVGQFDAGRRYHLMPALA